MAYGVKLRKITTRDKYTLLEFYNAIKDYPFEAGKPDLHIGGNYHAIAFPPIDRMNRVWIEMMSFESATHDFSVRCSDWNTRSDQVQDIWFGLFCKRFYHAARETHQSFYENRIRCEQQVDDVVERLCRMQL